MRFGSILMVMLSIALVTAILSVDVEGEESQFGDFNKHDTILIIGNENLTSGNGVSGGNGTLHNPFMITDLFINSTEGAGLEIRDSDLHIKVYQNVIIHAIDPVDPTNVTVSGIKLVNCTNITLERVYVYYFNKGLEVIGSSNIEVFDSSFSQNHDAIVMEADSSSITGCFCSYNTRFGVFINNSRGLFLKDILTDANSFTLGEGAGIQMVNCSDLVIVDCYGTLNYGAGISLIGSYDGSLRGMNAIIKDCYTDSCIQGVQVLHMDGVLIESTRTRGNAYGVHLVDVSEVVINTCEIYKNAQGIFGLDVRNLTVQDCDFDRNEIGMVLKGPSSWWVSGCLFNSSKVSAVKVKESNLDASCLNSVFTRNRFIGQSGEDDLVSDPTGLIEWSENGVGNYWEDWQGEDADNNGIVDSERIIPGGSSDPYPIFEKKDSPVPDTEGIDNRLLDDQEDKDPTEFWMIFGLSIIVTFGLAIFIVVRSRKGDDGGKESF